MAVDVKNLIAAINPDIFCDPGVRGEVKEILAEGFANKDPSVYLKAAAKAKPVPSVGMNFEDIYATGGAFKHPARENPIESHKLVLDNFGGSLEPIYFWILDYVRGYYGSDPVKLIDTFFSSVGSGHFAEMQGRATRMQEEAMKIIGVANQVIKSILNIIYDLKEFRMRLGVYDDLKSSDKNLRDAARLSLKQIWLDQVDIKRGNSSIKALAVSGANQPNFVTLIDAFMVVDSIDDLKKSPDEGGIDLNDRVKRILEQRIPEFIRWMKESEAELRKRFEIEKSYLRSQVNTVKLYSRWAKPYMKAARKLEQKDATSSQVIDTFNTLMLELAIMAVGRDYDVNDAVLKGDLPEIFRRDSVNKKFRKYKPIMIAEFKFRSIPDRTAQQQGYGFRGRLEAEFTSFALRADEVERVKKEVERDNFGDLFGAIEGATDESLAQINADIEEFLNDNKKAEKPKNSDDSNPFSALFSFLTEKEEKPKEKKVEKKSDGPDTPSPLGPDTEYETGIRNMTLFEARIKCRKVYDIYKKAHGLPNFPAPGG